MVRTVANKPTRLNIRVSEHEKDVLSRAARVLNTTVSNFVIQHACAEAQAVLTEQDQFRLPERKWRAFYKTLVAPAKTLPALRKLLREKSVFEE